MQYFNIIQVIIGTGIIFALDLYGGSMKHNSGIAFPKTEDLIDYFGLEYKKAVFKKHKHSIKKRINHYVEKCGNLSAFDSIFLYRLYRDIVIQSCEDSMIGKK